MKVCSFGANGGLTIRRSSLTAELEAKRDVMDATLALYRTILSCGCSSNAVTDRTSTPLNPANSTTEDGDSNSSDDSSDSQSHQSDGADHLDEDESAPLRDIRSRVQPTCPGKIQVETWSHGQKVLRSVISKMMHQSSYLGIDMLV